MQVFGFQVGQGHLLLLQPLDAIHPTNDALPSVDRYVHQRYGFHYFSPHNVRHADTMHALAQLQSSNAST